MHIFLEVVLTLSALCNALVGVILEKDWPGQVPWRYFWPAVAGPPVIYSSRSCKQAHPLLEPHAGETDTDIRVHEASTARIKATESVGSGNMGRSGETCHPIIRSGVRLCLVPA